MLLYMWRYGSDGGVSPGDIPSLPAEVLTQLDIKYEVARDLLVPNQFSYGALVYLEGRPHGLHLVFDCILP